MEEDTGASAGILKTGKETKGVWRISCFSVCYITPGSQFTQSN